jgi:NADH dehydrogenase (ubiquinone) 1 alpha subcomplex subunit 9
MSRRAGLRGLNGELSTSWRNGQERAAALHVTTAVFGCTGFAGTYTTAVAAHHRHTIMLPFRFRSGIQGGVRTMKCCGDGTYGQMFAVDYELDKEFVVKGILEKVGVVMNCVGCWQEPNCVENSSSWYSMESINVEWPRMLARWCRELGVDRFIHLSMVGADINSPSKVLRQKAMAEQAVMEEFPRATIIRSTEMFAEDDSNFTRMLHWQRMGNPVPMVNRGQRIMQPVFAGDIAEAMCRAVYLDYTQGRIAELGGPVRFAAVDFWRWAAECNAMRHVVFNMPYSFWKPLMKVYERSPFKRGMLIGSRPRTILNSDWVDRQFVDDVAMPERDPELMDWEDFGIAREDLFRMEEKMFFAAQIITKSKTYYDYGRYL